MLQAFNTHPSYAQVQQNLKTVYATLPTQAYNRTLDQDKGSSANPPQLAILDQVYQQQGLPEKTSTTLSQTDAVQTKTITPAVIQHTEQTSAKLVIEERKYQKAQFLLLRKMNLLRHSQTLMLLLMK